jgi:hypothetical protein
MKNYFKFIIAIATITFVMYGSIPQVSAAGEGYCKVSEKTCGTTPLGNRIKGIYVKTIPQP